MPLVIVDPRGDVAAGSRHDTPESTRDLAPTLLGLAGVAVPEGMPQRTLFPKVRGGVPTAAPLYAESLYGWDAFRWAQAYALRVGPWKFVDAGPEAFETDLTRDPRETGTTRHDTASAASVPAAGAPYSARDAIDVLHAAATGPAGTPASARSAATDGGGYWGGSGSPAAVLAPAENRKLASPYARIGDLALLDAGKALLAAGAAENALGRFDEVSLRDPANPQTAFWRGRALAALRRFPEADAAYRRSLDLGFLDPRCVEKALQACIQAMRQPVPDPHASERAVAFLSAARGKGVRDSCWTAIFEVVLWLERGEPDRAKAAHARSRRFPPTPETDDAIRQNEGLPGLRDEPR